MIEMNFEDSACEIREMDEGLIGEALEVYRWYVRNSTATFQIGEPTEDQMRSILFFGKSRYRSFALFAEGRFAGYGIVTCFKPREAYDRTAEVTIYLSHERTGKGYGRVLLSRLEAFAREQGIRVLVALVTGENEASRKLFGRSGYDQCAHYHEVGQKFGRLLDLVCFEKKL